MERTTVQLLRFSLALFGFCVHGHIGSVGGFSSGGYPGYYEAGLPMQDDVKQQSSSWYDQEDVSDPFRPLRSKDFTYGATSNGLHNHVSYSPQTGSYGSGPVISVYNIGSESDVRRQNPGSLTSSGGSFVSGSLATAFSTSVRSKTVPKPAQLDYQTVVQTSNESVASNSQQPVQTGSQSSGLLLANAQSFVKPQRSRLQVGSKLFSGGRPILSSSLGQQSAQASYQSMQQPSRQKAGLTRYQPVSQPNGLQSAQARYQSVLQPSALQSARANYQYMQQPSGQKPGLTRYQPLSQPSGLQSAQTSYQSVPLPSGVQSAQTSYQSVPQPSGLQSAQASYQSMQQPSGQKPGLTRYQPVSQPSGLQSAHISYQSVQQPSSQKPGLTRYQSVSQPSGLQSSQTNYQSAQAHYQSVSQPSGQSVSLQPGFQLPSMPEQSSYGSLSSFGSQPLEQPSNVQQCTSYESVLQPDLQDTAPLRSPTTHNDPSVDSA
ncbi:altered inheritance of mitochondria protein 3-like [Sinocyclocheilus rhinocerous]|uniref:altered inheritance of mitochondria protein 3-like n=1 Tax=Sinocyclocheilus rhinocerous TaxID=307959 RepID=UPI0007B84AAE|nr:PREDICTED: altered inheritance of mitochondria protein 3-like [Sinocyclocheilus rhinocerous]